MTSQAPGRRRPRRDTRTQAHWRRPGAYVSTSTRTALLDSTVYEFACWDHAQTLAWLLGAGPQPTMLVRGYQGQTVQLLEEREAQHAGDKPWFDLVEGHAYVLWRGRCDGPTLDRIEYQAIRKRMGCYNIEHATDLPTHVPKWEQYEQRWARDDAAGWPRWVPPEQRGRLQAASSWLDVRLHRLPPWQVKTGLWGSAWAILTAWLGLWTAPLSPRWSPLAAALAGALALLWGVLRSQGTRRARGRSWRAGLRREGNRWAKKRRRRSRHKT